MADQKPLAEAPETFHGRIGTFVLVGPEGMDLKELYPRLAAAVKADNRVADLAAPKLDPHWIATQPLFPGDSEDVGTLLVGSDTVFGVRYPAPLVFEVSVPTKNQPEIHGRVAVSDRYTVAWDGWTAVVLWASKPGAASVPASAGQVVIEILESVAQSLDLALFVQACSIGCQLKFAHRGMLVNVTSGSESGATFTGHGKAPVSVDVVDDKSRPVVAAVHHETALPAGEFAMVKNVARRILDLESAARELATELISLDYNKLARSQLRNRDRLRLWFHDRRHHKAPSADARSKVIITSLQLAMANIEVLQQTFSFVKRRYEDLIKDWATPDLFEADLKSDEAEVAKIDAQFARGLIEYKSTRIDNGVVVVATLVAGVAGGVLGLLGALLGGALSGGA